ncbi:M48 family metallopeptidase [Ornithobacterium rhinotracheale]|uniref:Putative metal-dependent hydrolase n=1 Tax=Ornithobacterium rhinotracheale (strain ATCC 51463 / DSM 15997 / CCUG 23171 / CIP 104009 / LMG 9086) TaxID=867902 RepID=I3ZXA9_ORNRL|nr:SprT family zinc-dependent metalloprotease [Ornithobacterium rhinotracheale]AFL96343.1 putative metal-dependent hydrolase [Ornithobacterium rhinotracheale DSM 15997]AIP98581.1 metal-dependent hydrolase [Ornithobacterium rhinotracheale ORT-UMN 88]KGB67763.1 metal-dependent hydrolase [Ornithobacterium rhinotracheale H06-030791]MCK0194669.1 M48 family metallopeptidase [Ornithobacterium rhinotracheale]MCK0201037.1 M48 family metallopeptidase [Ornithobacterium rhinotracheale]
MEKIIYGKSIIEFSISYSDRKTLGITVNPDLSVNIKAPLNSKKEDIFKIVEKRVPWILEQKRFFLSFEPRRTEYLYKSGETHYYLGRQYLLKIVEGKAEDVFYKGRYLLIETNDKSPLNIKKLLDRWYRDRAKIKFAEIAEPLIQQFKKYEVEPNNLYIQNMKFRWGSCSAKGNIILNPELIKAPKPCIEYVIIHELCHLIHQNHSKAFFQLQSREMPDWEKWKGKLEHFLA